MSTPTLPYIKTGGGSKKNWVKRSRGSKKKFDKNWGRGKDSLGLNLAYVKFEHTGV